MSSTSLLEVIQKLENELEEKEKAIAILEQYHDAMDSFFIISKADLRGNIVFVNKLFCEVSGYSEEELMGKPHSIIRHPNVPSSLYKELWETIEAKKVWRGVVENLHKNGKSYYVDATIFPLLDKEKNILSYVGVRNNITQVHYQKKRAQAILNAQESIVLLSTLKDSKIEVKQLNQKFFDVFNYDDMNEFMSKSSCIGNLFIDKEGYLSKNTDTKNWQEVLLEDESKEHLVLVNDKNNEERVFSAKAKEISPETESFIISTFTDVTNLQKARVEALSAEKAKSAFLSTMSHELRTPLNSVIGFSQILISKKDMPKETMQGFVEKINFSGKHLLNIVNNILDFSKIDSGNMDLSLKKVIVQTLIDESILLLENQAYMKNIKLITQNNEKKEILVDLQLMKQVIVNLLSNAIKFSPENSEISIGYEETKSIQQIEVCDKGVGIAQEKIATIFQSFSQIREDQNEAIKGTGLGLAISKKIVELHHGTIDIKSSLGKGSCFTIKLPKIGEK